MEYQPLELREFHGGITDNFIDAPLYYYEKGDNFLITANKKLYTRPGSEIYDADYYQIPIGAQRIGSYVDHFGTLLIQSSKKVYNIDGGWQTLQGPTGNDVFTEGDTNSRVVASDWNKHTFIGNDDFSPVSKIYIDAAGDLQVRTAGLPKLATDPGVAGTAGSNNYIYAFVYSYEYTVGTLGTTATVDFQDFGAVTQVQVQSVNAPDVNTINITSIPVFTNSTGYNYDTTTLKIKIYRTQNNGTTFNYIGEVTNGTTIYPDSASDASIVFNASLYTTGGQLDNDPTPLCKCLHITDTAAFYGHIKTDDGDVLSNRIRQSIPEDPDSCPETLYVDVDDSIVAISSAGQTPIVFCEKSIYRLDGLFDGTGGGLLAAQEIESTVGCISMNSVVQVQRGVVFAGETGFYFTDGWEVRKLSTNFNETYRNITITDEQKKRIYGTFDRDEKRVWWAVQEDGQTEVNKYFILDTRYGLGIGGENLEYVQAAFTTASNSTDFAPTASIFFEGNLLRGDSRGYTFKHDLEYTSDPLVDVTTNPSTWPSKTIIWDYKSVATSFGSTLRRKFVPRVTFSAENKTNVTIQIVSVNDIGRQSKGVKPIRFRKNWTWGEPARDWGDEKEIWDFKGIIEEERRFHSNSLRCSYKQVQLINSFDIILNSDYLTTATVNDSLKTATLDDITTYDWPLDCRGQFITFEDDDYQKEYEIVARTGDVITYLDPSNTIFSGSKKWTIKGYPKSEVLNLVSIAIWYAYLGRPADYAASPAGGTPA